MDNVKFQKMADIYLAAIGFEYEHDCKVVFASNIKHINSAKIVVNDFIVSTKEVGEMIYQYYDLRKGFKYEYPALKSKLARQLLCHLLMRDNGTITNIQSEFLAAKSKHYTFSKN